MLVRWRGWHSGIRRWVSFAAMIPAVFATASTSPFSSPPLRISSEVACFICTLPLATAWRVIRKQQAGIKKAPLPKRCCPKTKVHIPSFPSTGGTGISIRALEAFQPTVCLPWIIFRQDSSERANSRSWILYQGLTKQASGAYRYKYRSNSRVGERTMSFLSSHLTEPLREFHLLRQLPPPLPLLPPLLLSFQHDGN